MVVVLVHALLVLILILFPLSREVRDALPEAHQLGTKTDGDRQEYGGKRTENVVLAVTLMKESTKRRKYLQVQLSGHVYRAIHTTPRAV